MKSALLAKISRLARIELEEGEAPGIQAHLDQVLGWVSQVQEAQTPPSEPGETMGVERMRADEDPWTPRLAPSALDHVEESFVRVPSPGKPDPEDPE